MQCCDGPKLQLLELQHPGISVMPVLDEGLLDVVTWDWNTFHRRLERFEATKNKVKDQKMYYEAVSLHGWASVGKQLR
jgi:hypothetical protein